MANRYEIPFKETLEQQYKKPLLDVLIDFRNQGLTIKQVSELTGFHYSTVRFWCSRYAITMYREEYFPPKKHQSTVKESCFIERFRTKTINTFNVLSRKW